MRIVKILPSFERNLKRVSSKDRTKIKKSLHQLNSFITKGVLPKGSGLKKLTNSIYEIRMDIRLRIIIQMDEDVVYLVLVGSHSDIKRYLNRYR